MTSAVSFACPSAPRARACRKRSAMARIIAPSAASAWPARAARRSIARVILPTEAREKRPQVRPAHLAHLDPLARAGRIRLAGPLLDRTGSLIVLEADSLADVWALVARDPYVTEGVFNRVEVKPFQQVLP